MSTAPPSPITRFLVFLLSCVLVAGVGYRFWQQETAPKVASAPPPKAPNSVLTTTVRKDAYASTLEAVGTVHAFESADLMSNVTERITELAFDDGQVVKQGDLLAKLNDAEEQAMLAAAQSAMAEDEREIARLTSLVKAGAAPEAKLQERQTLADMAKQKIREAEAKLSDRRIVAPFAGVIGLRQISAGALVTPTTVIATLDKIDVVKIDFAVPETALPQLNLGNAITAKAVAASDASFTGKLAHLDTRIDPITRSVVARAEVPNDKLALKPGMLVMVSLAMQPRESLSLPERAIVPIGARTYVFTVTDGKAKRTEIKCGTRKPGYVEVLSGVSEREVVIADGLVGLQDGMTVKVTGEFAGPVEPFNPRGK